MNKKVLILIIVVVAIIIIGIYFFMNQKNPNLSESTASVSGSLQPISTTDIQGMKVETLKEGTGDGAKVGDNIVVNYVGTLLDGTKFDSSIDRNQPFPYTLGQNQVIKGWELGLLGMKVGEKRKLTIPSELAYGDDGRPPVIPAKATLVFEIDMLSINGK